MELYPHQKIAVEKLHNGSILWGGVGLIKNVLYKTKLIINYVISKAPHECTPYCDDQVYELARCSICSRDMGSVWEL